MQGRAPAAGARRVVLVTVLGGARVVGLGRTGTLVARRALALGMSVLAAPAAPGALGS